VLPTSKQHLLTVTHLPGSLPVALVYEWNHLTILPAATHTGMYANNVVTAHFNVWNPNKELTKVLCSSV
jgi:hypothetical protein